MIPKLLYIQNQLRIYHWQTESYAEHKALGKAYEGLDPLIDSLVESWMGATTFKIKGACTVTLSDYKINSPKELMDFAYTFMSGELDNYVSGRTELENIRDEMLAIVQTTRYLLKLK